MSEEFDLIDREGAILTRRDREVLTGQHDDELTDNAINQKFYRIRRNIGNALYDLDLLAKYLPDHDTRQIFEPAYEWGRKKRRLNEQGRESAYPELPMLVKSWLSTFELFAYGMYASNIAETQALIRWTVTEGIERGYRGFHQNNRNVFRPIAASLDIQYGNQVLWKNYLSELESSLPEEPDEIAEQVLIWHNERRIPHNIAQRWIQRYVRTPRSSRQM